MSKKLQQSKRLKTLWIVTTSALWMTVIVLNIIADNMDDGALGSFYRAVASVALWVAVVGVLVSVVGAIHLRSRGGKMVAVLSSLLFVAAALYAYTTATFHLVW